MKFEKVKYTAHYEGPIKIADWVSIDVILEGDETPEMGLDAAKQRIEGWHNKQSLPAPVGEIKTDHTPEYMRVAALISDIYSCTELPAKKGGLESFKKMVDSLGSKFPEVKTAYNQKHNQLNNKKKINLP